ncbi:hypothetical protein EVAR_64753_1 [Eumeta japonica]|uniref:Uncharacterized protein n=1 Tax=Eumeta variegata TaxID=151549 RepID=A0A4C1Z7H4_EUMVA|nr:hypothetical protein EVAR_64753_1 [Eumeta japonica]
MISSQTSGDRRTIHGLKSKHQFEPVRADCSGSRTARAPGYLLPPTRRKTLSCRGDAGSESGVHEDHICERDHSSERYVLLIIGGG